LDHGDDHDQDVERDDFQTVGESHGFLAWLRDQSDEEDRKDDDEDRVANAVGYYQSCRVLQLIILAGTVTHLI